MNDFSYLASGNYYFDSACQTLRPQSVIDAELKYYREYNACGGRVKYPWGERVDNEVNETRELLLNMLGLSAKKYAVAFTLNATTGINLVLQQVNDKDFTQIVTSDIEHNSVFLPSMTYARKTGLRRVVLSRDENGALVYKKEDLHKAIVILNTTSNIDGRNLINVKELAEDIHAQGGVLFLDACQTMGHNPELIKGVDFDALFASGHKMYAPSVGFVVIRKELLKKLDYFLLGGGTVGDVEKESFQLVEDPDTLYSRIEIGLQDYAAIIGLKEALSWRADFRTDDAKSADEYEQDLAKNLWQELKNIPELKLLYDQPSPVVSFYTDKIDSHTLGLYVAQQNIMCRTGYFCCHYYLKHLKAYPPLFRVSLGLHNTPEQIDFFVQSLKKILFNV
ncbi:MAG: hypothetical protein A2V81_03320 [Candidatus Abawacabacteria bacterium RBG_16_42_10]|uniref:Aminotransferase class V domain-containing protein n=1 Tax=Candidatus Abawacabacteria bacterium RBG_16_42_10 TaxID=1817814 RepID=A0A1F4XJS3_9BACT|nr:MAG: hypothetical protein A2V81_03320 [Candidatus Abawacabacteria bacterium RBG_16_42_10]